MTWVLGLDGGGTKTALAYASEAGEVVGPLSGPGINPFDQPDWATLLAGLLERFPAPGRLVHATLGLPGYGEAKHVSAEQERICASLIAAPQTVMNDVELAFRGAFPQGVGALLLAGTGSMSWASDGARQVRAGGCGEGFGDEGSAHWIGREALSLASQALDGRQSDLEFARLLLASLNIPLTDPQGAQQDLITWYYAQPHARSAVASLARTVDTLAGQQQPSAVALMQRAAGQLERLVRAVRAQLGTPDLPWSYAGSVLNSPFIRSELQLALNGAPQVPRFKPVGGALWHAANRAFGRLDDAWARHCPAPSGEVVQVVKPQP